MKIKRLLLSLKTSMVSVILFTSHMAPNQAQAQELLTTTFMGTGSGTIGTTAFNNDAFTITVVGNTSDIVPILNTGFSLDAISSTIMLSGLGTFSFTSGTRTFVNNGGVGFSRAGMYGADLFDGNLNTAFNSWNMLSSIGPIYTTGYLQQWTFSPPVTTSGGTLVFNTGSSSTVFEATISTVPEPGSYGVFAGLGMLFFAFGGRLLSQQK